MAAVLQSLGKTVAAGLALLAVMLLFAGDTERAGVAWLMLAARWLHVTCAMMWVGLLWYFNFVQMPSMPRIADEYKPAVTKVIAPLALFWFRWAALATVASGLALASLNGYVAAALMLRTDVRAIGIGMWLALLMAFNVWFIIWPNQKKALGLVAAPEADKPRAARLAMLTSRINVMLSVPMLYCMVAQQNGGL